MLFSPTKWERCKKEMKHKAKDVESLNAFLQIALLNYWFVGTLRSLSNFKTWQLFVGYSKKEIIYGLMYYAFLAIYLLCEVQQTTSLLVLKPSVWDGHIDSMHMLGHVCLC